MPIRPKEVSPRLKIFQAKIDREKLSKVDPEVRRNLLLFGPIGNEINTLNRLLVFSNGFIEQLLITITKREGLDVGPAKEVLTVDTHESTKTFRIPPLLRD